MSTNQLASQTSPYLLQHADNPVHWYPWGKEALQLAITEDKPILLSIGYSSCHWCHVMAHESFEDEATATLMNQHFINIKVDREERPDLDKIYQLSHQLLAQQPGGWPLTVFLTPQQLPFFAGTYFPLEPRYNMPAFTEILQQMSTAYHQQGETIAAQNQDLLEAMLQTVPEADQTVLLNPAPLDTGRRELEQQYDPINAGFGKAPKFPHPTSIERLLRHWHHTRGLGHTDQRALDMARFSLHAMASGGIFDQLAGGFCRYSTDDQWMVPHFEKMLYDNAQLLTLYAHAWQATQDPAYARVMRQTADWVMEEMQAGDGGYYAAQDADTEGEEGRYYVWQQDELHTLLDEQEYTVLASHYGFDREANFEGRWYPHIFQSLEQVAKITGLPLQRINTLLESGRQKLLSARHRRVRPATDTKVLCSWNSLMIKGMAQAGQVLQEDRLIDSAQRAIDFIRLNMWQDGKLYVSHKDGKAQYHGYLDDYAFLLDGLLQMLQVHWRSEDCEFAIELAEALLSRFEDPANGGFYFTEHAHETLIHRPRPTMDEALPSGSGVAATALQRLGQLLDEPRYLQAAERCLKACWLPISKLPYAHNALLTALEEYLYPGQTVVIRGGAESIRTWQAAISSTYDPRVQCYAIAASDQYLPAALAHKPAMGDACAYLCEGMQCLPPITDIKVLQSRLAPTDG